MSDCSNKEWLSIGEAVDFRDSNEDGVSAELKDVSSHQARLRIYSSFQNTYDRIVAVGEVGYLLRETNSSQYRFKVLSVTTSMKMARVEICHETTDPSPPPNPTPTPPPTPTPGGWTLPLYGSTTVFGIKFTNTRMMCDIGEALLRPEGLAERAVIAGAVATFWAVPGIILPGSLIRRSVILGGVYVALKNIDAGCTKATVDIFEATYTEEDHNSIVEEIVKNTENTPNPKTPEEVEPYVTQGEKNIVANGTAQQIQEDVASGKITPEEGEEAYRSAVTDEAHRLMYAENFSLVIPSLVMAGDIDVSGFAPKNEGQIQICAVKKFGGFDFLKKDDVLVTTAPDVNYAFADTITLDEFGCVSVYARIPKEWWDVLGDDLKTTPQTVLVVTPTILLAILAIIVMVLDKKYGFIGIFKKGGRKK